MSRPGDANDSTSGDSEVISPGNSFVYPVRTLLSGIQPSPNGMDGGAHAIEAHDEQRNVNTGDTRTDSSE